MSSADITGIHTVGVPVADQDKALAFYTGTLGLSTRKRGSSSFTRSAAFFEELVVTY